jgi:uridine kinase
MYLVMEKLKTVLSQHEVYFILILSKGSEKEYLNTNYKMIDEPNVIAQIILDDYDISNYRNSLNCSHKIFYSLKNMQSNYDLYIIMRSDLILESLNINDIQANKLYFSSKQINEYTINNPRINDNIILCTNTDMLLQMLDLHEFNTQNPDYLDVNLYKYLNKRNIDYELIDIDYKLVLSNCNIIAIAGDSGSGKTTLSKILSLLFKKEICLLETDRYHKWERGDIQYKNCTHLNPAANYLEKMCEDIYQLKIGHTIFQVDYDHSTGKFTPKQKIANKQNLILCGLHTLYQTDMNNLLNLKIFLDTERNLIKKWKIQRDVNERGYNLEKVLTQIDNREADYLKYILVQKHNANIVINFYEIENTIQCNFIIKESLPQQNIIKQIVNLNYIFKYNEHNELIIHLKNAFDNDYIDNHIKTQIEQNEHLFIYHFYKEILYLISLIISL